MNPVPFERPRGDDLRLVGLNLYLDLEFVGCSFDRCGRSRPSERHSSVGHRAQPQKSRYPAGRGSAGSGGSGNRRGVCQKHTAPVRHDPGAIVLNNDRKTSFETFLMLIKISGSTCASSQASSELSTASLMVVMTPRVGESNPRRCLFFEKFRDTDAALLLCEVLSEHHALPPRRWQPEDPTISAPRSSGS